ncbi:Cytochrome c1 heme lyase [Dispira parvispora]|uniref:Holocytochrome c-type synthase n=1 Tax=Dispira parvispora TaxID=1520584 RepID=A0A9W8E394_9FUNG|nr:Cytochrome c1 heme lyase [Dispira parvispora]
MATAPSPTSGAPQPDQSTSGCPHQAAATASLPTTPTTSNASERSTECPVTSSSATPFAAALGIPKEKLNPDNYMPNISQRPHPQQVHHLSSQREKSTIPRSSGDTSSPTASTTQEAAHTSHQPTGDINPAYQSDDGDQSVWVYPSEQMFYNAMKRKNWSANERDMHSVVAIHNIVNEMTWKKIMEWEAYHQSDCPNPTLLRFQGRPQDVSPKARFRNLFGYTLPFDRHDWVVDRCGKEVTYIIDYYAGNSGKLLPQTSASGVNQPSVPGDKPAAQVPSFYLDVRPKLTPQSFVDHIRHFFSN